MKRTGILMLRMHGFPPVGINADRVRRQVVARIRSLRKPKGDFDLQSYLGSPYPVLGLTTPQIRQVHKEFREAHPHLTASEVNELAAAMWAGPSFEEKNFAIGLLGRNAGVLDERSWALADTWVDAAVGWALSDNLASGPISAMVHGRPARFNEILRWTRSENFWRRRASTYALNEFVRAGELDRPFRLLERLLYDDEFWVQRAVGTWLLYTRRGQEGTDDINTLWVASTILSDFEPFSLRAANVVHFADWSPDLDPLTVAYSTVEPRPAAPGWQANNDLILAALRIRSDSGRVSRTDTIIPANAGGQYGWWGTSYAWGDEGDQIAFARADGVGLIDLDSPDLEPVLTQAPYQTLGDWAWVPGLDWGHDGQTLFTVRHGAPVGLESEAASPVFDVVALQPSTGSLLPMQERSGMFAYPSVSPVVEEADGELGYRIAFLQALTPLESRDSNYQVVLADRDGSNRQNVFPAPGEPGIEPQRVVWSPGADRIALIYRGDVYIVDTASGVGHRLTSDGQAAILDWAP